MKNVTIKALVLNFLIFSCGSMVMAEELVTQKIDNSNPFISRPNAWNDYEAALEEFNTAKINVPQEKLFRIVTGFCCGSIIYFTTNVYRDNKPLKVWVGSLAVANLYNIYNSYYEETAALNRFEEARTQLEKARNELEKEIKTPF